MCSVILLVIHTGRSAIVLMQFTLAAFISAHLSARAGEEGRRGPEVLAMQKRRIGRFLRDSMLGYSAQTTGAAHLLSNPVMVSWFPL